MLHADKPVKLSDVTPDYWESVRRKNADIKDKRKNQREMENERVKREYKITPHKKKPNPPEGGGTPSGNATRR